MSDEAKDRGEGEKQDGGMDRTSALLGGVAAENTDREIWRRVERDFYSPSIHVTRGGGIGINVGGTVIVMPVERWHELAMRYAQLDNG